MRHFVLAIVLMAAACATAPTPAPTPPSAPQQGSVASPVPAAIARDESASLNPADAPAGAYTLDPRHASVTWRIRHLGLGLYTARFDTIAGTLAFDPANPANSNINVTIAANSVSTGLLNRQGERAFDREISEALGAAAHPNITFASRSVQVTGPTTGLITGDLTLNGQTRPVTLEASFHGGRFVVLRGKHQLAFAARTIIRRSEWGVTQWGMFTGDEVEILIDAEFVQD